MFFTTIAAAAVTFDYKEASQSIAFSAKAAVNPAHQAIEIEPIQSTDRRRRATENIRETTPEEQDESPLRFTFRAGAPDVKSVQPSRRCQPNATDT